MGVSVLLERKDVAELQIVVVGDLLRRLSLIEAFGYEFSRYARLAESGLSADAIGFHDHARIIRELVLHFPILTAQAALAKGTAPA
jgi:hypothetical protein